MSLEICVDLLGQVLRMEKKKQANLQAMHSDGDTAKDVSSLAIVIPKKPACQQVSSGGGYKKDLLEYQT